MKLILWQMYQTGWWLVQLTWLVSMPMTQSKWCLRGRVPCPDPHAMSTARLWPVSHSWQYLNIVLYTSSWYVGRYCAYSLACADCSNNCLYEDIFLVDFSIFSHKRLLVMSAEYSTKLTNAIIKHQQLSNCCYDNTLQQLSLIYALHIKGDMGGPFHFCGVNGWK